MNNSNPPKLDFQGFSNPTTTPVPDVVFDTLMFFLTDPELRVLLYVIRRTFGFKKTADNISLKQLVEGIKTKDGKVLDLGTGVTKPTVTKAVKGLVEKGVIIAERNRSKERGDEPTTYRLRFREEDPVLTDFTRGSIPYLHGGVKPTLHGGVNALNTQQTVIQKTVDNSIVVVLLIPLLVHIGRGAVTQALVRSLLVVELLAQGFLQRRVGSVLNELRRKSPKSTKDVEDKLPPRRRSAPPELSCPL